METDITKQLNILLKRNYDAEKGYKQAADQIEDKDLKIFFTNNVEERYRFGHEIKNILSALGGEIHKGTTLEGDIHRAWMNVREKLAMNDDKAVLKECARGEEQAVEDYINTIENLSLKPEHKETLSDHLHSVRNSLQQLKKLEALV